MPETVNTYARLKERAADYQKRYGMEPDLYGANYYEGVYVIAE